MKQQILEEFENEFYGVLQDDGGLGKRGDKIGNLDGFLPPHLDLNDVKAFLSSSIDRVIEEARKCVPNEIEDTCGCRECSEAADLLRNQAAKTLQALNKLKV